MDMSRTRRLREFIMPNTRLLSVYWKFIMSKTRLLSVHWKFIVPNTCLLSFGHILDSVCVQGVYAFTVSAMLKKLCTKVAKFFVHFETDLH